MLQHQGENLRPHCSHVAPCWPRLPNGLRVFFNEKKCCKVKVKDTQLAVKFFNPWSLSWYLHKEIPCTSTVQGLFTAQFASTFPPHEIHSYMCIIWNPIKQQSEPISSYSWQGIPIHLHFAYCQWCRMYYRKLPTKPVRATFGRCTENNNWICCQELWEIVSIPD